MKKMTIKIIRFIGRTFFAAANFLESKIIHPTQKIKDGDERSLYKTQDEALFWLTENNIDYVDMIVD